MFKRLTGCLLMLCCTVVLWAQPAQKNTYYDAWSNAGPLKNADFFPIAVWYQPPSRAADYATAGVNLYIGPSVDTPSELQTLKDNGLYTIAHFSGTLLNDTNSDRVVGWMQNDEPDNDQSGAGCVDTSLIQSYYTSWVSQDATRPIYLNLGKGVAYLEAGLRGTCTGDWEMYAGYIRGCDIASYDIYPTTDDDAAVQGNLWYVAKGIDSLRSWSGYAKPAWCWIECTHINATVMPTPKATKAEVWMALIHEAAGFGYFCHEWYPSFSETAWLSRYPDMKASITQTNNEIAGMAEALNSPSIVDQVETVSNWRTPVETMLKAQGGYTYLYAVCNRRSAPTNTVTFTVTGLPASCTAEVIGESRSITVTDGVFQDEFDEWTTHLYKINATVAIEDSPVKLQRTLDRGTAVRVLPDGTVQVVLHRDLTGQPVDVAVVDAAGKRVAEPSAAPGYGTYEWRPDGTAPGVYFVAVRSGQAALVRPVVVQ